MDFYSNLSENGVKSGTTYTPSKDFKKIIEQLGYTKKLLIELSGVSESVIRSCMNGRNISKQSVDKIQAVLTCNNLFTPVDETGKLSGSTVLYYHRLLSSILTTAVQWQVIPNNPCERVKPPKADTKESQSLDDVQVWDLIECLQSEPLKFKTAVMLLLYTGSRRGEVCGLNWSDIDLDNGIIHITKSLLYLPDRGLFEDSTKNKSSERAVNIPNDMIDLLKEYKQEQEKEKILLGDQWEYSGKVFTSETGGLLHPDTLSGWFSRFIKRHNLPNAHLHTLRHTSATLLIASGVDIRTVSNRLGHADTTTTLNIYTHAIKSANEIAAQKLENMLNPLNRKNQKQA